MYNPARTREEKLVCRGMRIPKLDEVKAFAATNGIDADTAEDFWLNCEATGWRYKGSAILNWRSMIKSWARSRKRNADLEAARTAHIDAKMDERERRCGRRWVFAGGVREVAWGCCGRRQKFFFA